VKYCTQCIIPESRPNIRFNNAGICNACESHATKPRIDWQAREKAFRSVVENARSRKADYDCLIPVSGGKDSTWQVVKCLEYGLKPLAVTWRPPLRTELGAQNLENLIRLGVDHIDFRINPNVEKKFFYQALLKFGNMGLPMHMAIFNIPLRIASKFEIPLIIWGENSAFEYGGTEEEHKGFKLSSEWLKKFGVSHGTTAKDWISDRLSAGELVPYTGPSDQELESKGLLAIFLGYYFEWDPQTSVSVAKSHGFAVREEGPRTGYYNYADLDDDFIAVHHYLKWYKYGFFRSYDNLSVEIRNGRLKRSEAIRILKKLGDETPHEDIKKFCDFIGITTEHFFEVAERFRNQTIWKKQNGTWVIPNFLVPDWDWSAHS
jgi:N-acetyl sugar amidotransferase